MPEGILILTEMTIFFNGGDMYPPKVHRRRFSPLILFKFIS